MIRHLILSRAFLTLIFLACVASLGVAWHYQYNLHYGPCVLCIHVRMAVMLIAAVALLGATAKKSKASLLLTYIGLLGGAGWMLERSVRTLGIEQGWIDGACSMNLGLPSWLPLDQWLPTAFEAWEPCGYTPEVFETGITMAEALVAGSGLLTLAALLGLLMSLGYQTNKNQIKL